MTRIESLQVLRAVAACSVVLLHATNLQTPTEHLWRFDAGAAGVDLFFVISGVIITLVAKGSPGVFLKRRLWRIVPLYFVLSAFAYAVNKEAGPANALVTLTFWPAWDQMTEPALGVGWTLCFEMLFYSCAALALVIPARLIVSAYGLCVVGLYLSGAPVFQFLGNPIICEFLFGVMIGLWWQRGGRLSWPWTIAALGALAILTAPDVVSLTDVIPTMIGTTSAARVVYVGIPSGLIVAAFLSIDRRWPQWMVTWGDASYSIYLAHATALTPFAFVILPSAFQPFRVPLFLCVAAAASFASYRWLEMPIREYAKSRRQASEGGSAIPNGGR